MDAYTLRKIAPRILIGVIGINLSIYLCIAAIDITNIIGHGIGDLLRAPFLDADSYNKVKGVEPNTENTIVGIVGVGAIGAFVALIIATGGAAAVSVLGMLLPLLTTVLLVAVAVLVTVVIRYGLLILLTVVSPVAIACFILPGTEKYFRQWWDIFVKTLIVYPIIAVFFAISDILAAVFLVSAKKEGDGIGLIFLFMAILAVIVPLFMIPFAFKLAGGVLGSAFNLANGAARNMSNVAGQKIKASREDPNSWLGSRAAKTRNFRQEKGLTGGAIMSGVTGGIGSTARGRGFRSGWSGSRNAISSSKVFDDASAFMEKNAAFQSFKGNDDALWAFRNGNDEASVRRILSERGVTDPQALSDTTAQIMRAKKQVGAQAGHIAATRAQAATGTGYEDNGQMLRDIAGAAGGDMNTAGRMLAEMRGAAVQSGRGDLGLGSFNTQMVAMSRLSQADSGGPAYSAAQAQDDIMDSVIMSPGAAQAVAHGKPASAQAISGAHVRNINKLLGSMSSGEEVKIGGQTRVATARDVKQAFAVANAVHDNLRAAGGENAIIGADMLMGTGINTDNLSDEAKAALGPAWENQSGSTVSGGPDGGLSIREIMHGYHGQDQAYDEIRQDFTSRMQEAAGRGQIDPNAGGPGPQPPTGGPPGPTAPGS